MDKYILNQSLLLRENDSSAFNSYRFEIINFTVLGYKIISMLQDRKFTFTDYMSIKNVLSNTTDDDLNIFFKKCKENDIFIKI